MQIFIELTIGFVVAIIIYNVLHHFLVTIPDRKYQIAVKKQVDNEVFQIISELKDEKSVLVIDRFINSSVLTSVWGRGVMVFEYRCHVKSDYDLKYTRTIIDNKLRKQAKQDNFIDENGNVKLILTDCWLNNHILVFDVADERNRATYEYVKDIKKMDEK